jgi:hypothetical protein
MQRRTKGICCSACPSGYLYQYLLAGASAVGAGALGTKRRKNGVKVRNGNANIGVMMHWVRWMARQGFWSWEECLLMGRFKGSGREERRGWRTKRIDLRSLGIFF